MSRGPKRCSSSSKKLPSSDVNVHAYPSVCNGAVANPIEGCCESSHQKSLRNSPPARKKCGVAHPTFQRSKDLGVDDMPAAGLRAGNVAGLVYGKASARLAPTQQLVEREGRRPRRANVGNRLERARAVASG